jgi:uncharacterized protein YbaP (TraB family)
LWKVESAVPGQDQVLYLAGSVHALGRQAYPLAASFEQAFAASTTLVEEIGAADSESGLAGTALMAKARLQPGDTLEKLLSPDTYKRFVAFTTATKLPADKLGELKPWAIAVVIQALVSQGMGLDPALGLDRHFLERAKARRMPVVGLETAAEQLDRLDKLPAAAQDRMLSEAVTNPAEGASELAELVTAWRKGDVEKLEMMVKEDFANEPDAYKSMIVERNHNWMPTMEKCLSGQKCFVVVGAAHLVGPDGLIALLRAKGYRVSPL